jgi:hypothetical protein
LKQQHLLQKTLQLSVLEEKLKAEKTKKRQRVLKYYYPINLWILLVVPLFSVAGCVQGLWYTETLSAKSSEYRCDPPPTPLPLDIPVQAPPPSIYEEPTYTHKRSKNLNRFYTKQALQIADILKLRPLLEVLAILEEEVKKESTQEALLLRMVYIREKLVSRIMLANMEVLSVSAEAACEAARADRAAARIEFDEASKVRNQTLLAVTVAGAASIIGGILVLIPANEYIGAGISIASGLVETVFGSTALFTRSRQEFLHTRNMLRELWKNPKEPEIFPLPVWRYLHIPQYTDPQQRTLREQLIAGWEGEGRLGEEGNEETRKRKKLIFGDGGHYGANDLRARAEMLYMLRSTLNLLLQDVELLLREVLVREMIFEQKTESPP